MIDNYLENIRSEIINGNAKVVTKNYQINNVKLTMNYNTGKELAEAGKHYGEGIVKKYAKEFGKGYTFTELTRMKQFLTWSHYKLLLPLKNVGEIKYYISITKRDNLSKRVLAERIKTNKYDRLSDELKEKLLNNKKSHFGKMAFKLIIYILWYKFINIINHIFLFVFVFIT